jgi:hypothetical protein
VILSTPANTPITQGLHVCTAVLPKTTCACEGCKFKTPRCNPALSNIVQQQWRNTLGAQHLNYLRLPSTHACSRHQPPCKQLSVPLLTTPAASVPALVLSALPVNMHHAKRTTHTFAYTHVQPHTTVCCLPVPYNSCEHTLYAACAKYPSPQHHTTHNTHTISQYCTVSKQRQAGATHMLLAACAAPVGASHSKSRGICKC